MVEKHADKAMVRRVIAKEVESDEEVALHKFGHKCTKQSSHLLIKLPELTTNLIEAYKELAQMTRPRKDIASSSR